MENYDAMFGVGIKANFIPAPIHVVPQSWRHSLSAAARRLSM